MNATPSPSIMQKFAPKVTFQAPSVVADVAPEQPAKIVRPGVQVTVEVVEHDGVFKAKQLPALLEANPNLVVQAWLHGKPCGGEHAVATAKRSEDGSTVLVTFSSPRPDAEYKAAYHFYAKALVGTAVRHRRTAPALVPYTEV